MKILLLGSNGMLGTDVSFVLNASGHEVISIDHQQLDVTNESHIGECLSGFSGIDYIINCTGFTRVDDCESQFSDAVLVNGTACEYLAKHCARLNIPLVHFSTDYVFDGTLDRPYRENDSCHPINKYGQSKWIGEDNIQKFGSQFYIFRIQWLYGQNGHHFIKSILNAVESGKPLSIVCDQWGSPSWTRDIARCVTGFLEQDPPTGTYHLANTGYTTWYDFANYFLHYLDINVAVNQQTTFEFDRPAKRPLNGRLDTKRFLTMSPVQPLSWRDAVTEFLDNTYL